MTDPSMH